MLILRWYIGSPLSPTRGRYIEVFEANPRTTQTEAVNGSASAHGKSPRRNSYIFHLRVITYIFRLRVITYIFRLRVITFKLFALKIVRSYKAIDCTTA